MDSAGIKPACCHVVATLKTTVSISQCKVRQNSFWRVRWHDAGRIHRKFFSSKEVAEAHASLMRGDAITARKKIVLLPQSDIEQLLLIRDEAERRGVPLPSIIAAVAKSDLPKAPTCKFVLDEMIEVKRKAGRAEEYLSSLSQFVTQFINGRNSVAIDVFTVDDALAFLDSKNLASKTTARSRLATFFKYAVRRRYRTDNPCAQLEPITYTQSTPEVMTIAELKTALKWLKVHPRSLAWFVLTTFAGLRPEEAMQIQWHDINAKEGWIRVEAQTTKVRQRRVLYPKKEVFPWLKMAKRLKSELPLTPKRQLADRKELRKVLKWPVWKQDITRHTAASYWLAGEGETVRHVAKMLGHSEAICESRYKAVKTQKEASEFWKVVSSITNKYS